MAENRIRKVASLTASPSPARAPHGPAAAGIEYDSDVNALIVNPDGTQRALPETFSVTAVLGGSQPATSANYGYFYRAPYGVEVVSVKARFGTASSSGTVTVKKVPSGTAIASGTAVLASAMSTAGTADTDVAGTLSSTAADTKLDAGDALALVSGGTLTSGANLIVTVELKRRPDTL